MSFAHIFIFSAAAIREKNGGGKLFGRFVSALYLSSQFPPQAVHFFTMLISLIFLLGKSYAKTLLSSSLDVPFCL